MTGWVYDVQVVGTVSESDLARLDAEVGEVHSSTEPATTVVRGTVADQSALVGLLDLMHSLGLEVCDIRRVPDLDGGDGDGTGHNPDQR